MITYFNNVYNFDFFCFFHFVLLLFIPQPTWIELEKQLELTSPYQFLLMLLLFIAFSVFSTSVVVYWRGCSMYTHTHISHWNQRWHSTFTLMKSNEKYQQPKKSSGFALSVPNKTQKKIWMKKQTSYMNTTQFAQIRWWIWERNMTAPHVDVLLASGYVWLSQSYSLNSKWRKMWCIQDRKNEEKHVSSNFHSWQ